MLQWPGSREFGPRVKKCGHPIIDHNKQTRKQG